MIVYLLKFIGCSGLLLLFYYAALQNDRLFRFNRFFLLGIIILSILIPVTIVRTQIIEVPVYSEPVYAQLQTPILEQATLIDNPKNIESTGEPTVSWQIIVLSLYLLISATLLLRFCRNLYAILALKRNSKIVVDKGINIILRTDIKASFSFLNHMYTNQTRYEQGKLPAEIVEHEKHHIEQKHSYDIILVELLQCVLWFNPFLYFIKAAVKLNHEFLADQHVLKDNPSVYSYQKILLDITRNQVANTPVFASNLNYGFTKKRLNMMTKNTNRFKSMAKQVAAAGIIAGAFSIGGETRVIAQEVDLSPNMELDTKIDLNRNLETDVSMNLNPNLELDLQDTLKKKVKPIQKLLPPPPIKLDKVRFKDTNGRTIEKRFSELSESEKERFRDKASDPEFYMPPPPPSYMDEEILLDFQDTKKYGVWLNNKRVDNEAIKPLKVMDVHHYSKSKLFKNAANYGKHEYQLNIITRDYFKTQPNADGTWLDYIYPTLIKKKVQEQFQEKNEELKEAPELKEVPQVVEIKQFPQISEEKEVQEVDEVKTQNPKVIEIQTIKSKAEKTKEKLKNKSGQIKEKIKEMLQDLKVKKGEFNPELHSPGIDLEKVEYFLAPTFSAHLKYTDKSGRSVVQTYGEMTDGEYSMWLNPKNNGQVFNPPKAVKSMDYSEFFALKKKSLEFWIDGKLASPNVLDDLDYHQVYDWKMADNKVSITSDYVFLEDEKAWISRIRYKKAE